MLLPFITLFPLDEDGKSFELRWLTREPDTTNRRRVIFVKCRIEGEPGGTMAVSMQISRLFLMGVEIPL